MNCPICKSDTTPIKNISRTFIKSALSKYFNTAVVPDEIIDTDYQINSCPSCTLEFANPLTPGNDHFYNWITKQDHYYPAVRWEYSIAKSLIISDTAEKVKVIDIGCGSGDFLEILIKDNNNIIARGLDSTESSVQSCKDKGLDVSCVYLEDIVKDHLNYFDFVTSFHVLEHVSDPYNFVAEMKKILKPGGSILLSTPYSPMSFETDWYDPLNHPPHHMSRWNTKSYTRLADLLNMKINFIYPETLSTFRRTCYTIKYKNNIKDRLGIIKSILLKPISFINIYRHQLKREKLPNGQYAPNVVLVKLTKND